MVSVSASINLPLHHKVQKFSSGTSSPGWSRKKGRKTVVCVCVCGFGVGCSTEVSHRLNCAALTVEKCSSLQSLIAYLHVIIIIIIHTLMAPCGLRGSK